MNNDSATPNWRPVAILTGRLIFAAVFLMAVFFKFAGMEATAGYITSAGFPNAYVLAWVATIFELALAFGLLTGAFFLETTLLAAAYILFLGLAFHGPAYWETNQVEFGFFVDHFTFIAGLLYAAVQGPGELLRLRLAIDKRA